jgi:hypothetical protein
VFPSRIHSAAVSKKSRWSAEDEREQWERELCGSKGRRVGGRRRSSPRMGWQSRRSEEKKGRRREKKHGGRSQKKQTTMMMDNRRTLSLCPEIWRQGTCLAYKEQPLPE